MTMCAFNVANDFNTSVAFLACMDGIAEIGGDATAATTTCAGQTNLDISTITTCSSGAQGKTLLAAAGKKYAAAIAKESGADHFVPDVQIDGIHQIPSYNEATLKKDICTAGSGASFCN